MKRVAAAVAALCLIAGEASASAVVLNFSSVQSGIQDRNGLGTGFNARLPGTGSAIGNPDPNLQLDTAQGRLNITSTRSDLNGQNNLASGEYLGMGLSGLGYATRTEDFLLRAVFRNAQAPDPVDQFGIFLGSSSTNAFRMGVLTFGTPQVFTVQTAGNFDTNLTLPAFGIVAGDDLAFEIGRVAGAYTIGFYNLTRNTSRIVARDLSFLNNVDLVAGVFVAKTNANAPNFVASVDQFELTVPEPASLALAAAALALMGGFTRRRAAR